MKTSLLPSFRFAAFIAGALLALNAPAQTTTLKHADKSFIEKAAKAGSEELTISQIAVTRTTNSQVKEFAEMVVSDHAKANETLFALAAAKGVKLSTKEMGDAEKWSKKDLRDLDEHYVEKMISAHKDAVDLYEKQANKGDDPETKAFARETLPKLQHHLQMALDLKKVVK